MLVAYLSSATISQKMCCVYFFLSLRLKWTGPGSFLLGISAWRETIFIFLELLAKWLSFCGVCLDCAIYIALLEQCITHSHQALLGSKGGNLTRSRGGRSKSFFVSHFKSPFIKPTSFCQVLQIVFQPHHELHPCLWALTDCWGSCVGGLSSELQAFMWFFGRWAISASLSMWAASLKWLWWTHL